MVAPDDDAEEPSAPSPRTLRFAAAPPDLFTRGFTLFTGLIMMVLVIGGAAQTMVGLLDSDLSATLRGLAFAALGLGLVTLLVARFPVAYRLEDDRAHGTLLVIERRRFSPIRLVVSRYENVEAVHRVMFPWVPLLSGSRILGLTGAKVEASITGFWSFGCDGRRAVVFLGGGRPRTLISPLDPPAFLEGLGSFPDASHLIVEVPDEGGVGVGDSDSDTSATGGEPDVTREQG